MSKFKEKPQYRNNTTPELITPVQRLMNIINDRMDRGKSHPAMMPERQQDAANWWIERQEPMGDKEKAYLEWMNPKKSTDERKQVWKTPYADRLAETLAAFYKLSHAEQMYVLDLWSQGIWWRGDSIEFMRKREKVDMNRIDKTKMLSMMKKIIYLTKSPERT